MSLRFSCRLSAWKNKSVSATVESWKFIYGELCMEKLGFILLFIDAVLWDLGKYVSCIGTCRIYGMWQNLIWCSVSSMECVVCFCRQSYDIDLELEVEGTDIRSTNTLDLKNPCFRYTGQQVQAPPGSNHLSPTDAYWNQQDCTGTHLAKASFYLFIGFPVASSIFSFLVLSVYFLLVFSTI